MRRAPLLLVLGALIIVVGIGLVLAGPADGPTIQPSQPGECAPFEATTIPGQTTLTTLPICDPPPPITANDDPNAPEPTGTRPPPPTTEGPDDDNAGNPCLLVEDMGNGVTHTVQVPDCEQPTLPPHCTSGAPTTTAPAPGDTSCFPDAGTGEGAGD